MAEIVPTGPYFGFTYIQLTAELTNLIVRRQRVSSLIGSSINGQSFNREGSMTELRTLERQLSDLQDALAFMRPDLYQASGSRATVIQFRDH